MEQRIFRVKGMKCAACEQRIKLGVARFEGVQAAVANREAGEVRVLFDPARVDAAAIRTWIEQAGYEVMS